MELRDLINFPEKKELPHRFSVDSNCKMQTSAYCIDLGYNQAISEIGDIQVEVDRKKAIIRVVNELKLHMGELPNDVAKVMATTIVDNIADNLGEIIK